LTEADLAEGRVYPPLEKIRDISATIATAVAKNIVDNHLATLSPIPTDENLLDFMKEQQYDTTYPDYTKFV
jgi:malic enzyme